MGAVRKRIAKILCGTCVPNNRKIIGELYRTDLGVLYVSRVRFKSAELAIDPHPGKIREEFEFLVADMPEVKPGSGGWWWSGEASAAPRIGCDRDTCDWWGAVVQPFLEELIERHEATGKVVIEILSPSTT